MPETLNYDRPLAVPVVSTPIVFELKYAEKPNTPIDPSPTGTTSDLDCIIQADAEPNTLSTNWKDLFRIEMTQALSVAGIMSVTIVVTPIHGDGTLGTPVSNTFIHDQNMDTWQLAAGYPRV